ncbi:hypothetical protein RRSWK_06728 [Rhodopirellula sp. SWK7]|nr:hypothetical protein RRSWK_06728 [Rhodopirellula sp. SWK7]
MCTHWKKIPFFVFCQTEAVLSQRIVSRATCFFITRRTGTDSKTHHLFKTHLSVLKIHRSDFESHVADCR